MEGVSFVWIMMGIVYHEVDGGKLLYI